MLFFRRILMGGAKRRGSERRSAPRYAVSSDFPIKAVLNAAGRDLKGQPLTAKGGGGWDRDATVVDLSLSGAHLHAPHRIEPTRDDPCTVKLDLEGYRLELPGRIAHVERTSEEVVFGIAFEFADEVQRHAYDQLLDLVAFGAGLRPAGPAKPGSDGLIHERHEGDGSSQLDVWREAAGRKVTAFEFQLKDCTVRGRTGVPGIDCLKGAGNDVAPANHEEAAEILRLFQWVVLNLSRDVPPDVRACLIEHAL
jgi:hypothetical protein